MNTSVVVFFPLPSDFTGVNKTCLSICEAIRSERLQVEVVTPMIRRAVHHDFVSPTVPRFVRWLPYNIFRRQIDWVTAQRFLRKTRGKQIAYLWSSVTSDFALLIKQQGVVVIREKFNCHQRYAKRILDAEYKRIGRAPSHRITEANIENEERTLEIADYIFCPSPMVKESLIHEGVPKGKLLDSARGWDPRELELGTFEAGSLRFDKQKAKPVFLFVGRICVRKGVHLLLEYWAKAGVFGELILVGSVDKEIEEICGNLFCDESVTLVGHTNDVGSFYRRADVFVFPSLEEAGPKVTYEAMSHALPVLVSQMGAGAIARDERHGYVRDSHDESGWIQSLRMLAECEDLRRSFGEAGALEAENYTWKALGQRLEETLCRIGNGVTSGLG